MIVLETNKIFQRFIGLQSSGPGSHRGYIIAPILISIPILSLVLSISLNFILNIHDDSNRVWSTLPTTIALFVFIILYWHLLFNRRQFYSLFENMQDIVDERSQRNEKLYAESQQRIKILTKICACTSLSIPGATLVPFIVVFYHVCLGNYTIHSWFLYYPLWMPFEVDTTVRWAALAGLEIYGNIIVGIIYLIILCFFTELTKYTETFMLDINSLFTQVDDLTNCRNPDESSIIKRCKEAVDIHTRVYQCMPQLAHASAGIILSFVPPCILCICSSLLMIEQSLGKASLFDLMMPICMVISGLLLLHILFYFGEKLHSDLLNLNDMIYQSEWHRYPCKVRLFVLLMIVRAQKPFYLSAFGIIELNLVNFQAVLKWIYSALMVFRSV